MKTTRRSRKPTRVQKIVADLKLQLLEANRQLGIACHVESCRNVQLLMQTGPARGELIVRRAIEHMRLSGAEIGARLILVDHLVAHFPLRPFPEPPAEPAPVPAPLPPPAPQPRLTHVTAHTVVT